MNYVILVTVLLFGVTFLAGVSNKYNLPFPIILVLTGLLISIIPGLPAITLRPEIVFLIFSAAFAIRSSMENQLA